jgi:acetylornithine deacetylase
MNEAGPYKVITLLKSLISTSSFSGEENQTAQLIREYLSNYGIEFQQIHNNIIAFNKHYDPSKKTILLNSHHDTVKVAKGWTRDPFGAKEEGDCIFGLGSNDAGGALVGLIQTFIEWQAKKLPFNIVLAATAEEENSGPLGLSIVLKEILGDCTFGIIGEPTSLEIGVAQKGLIVIDGLVTGKAGHAARNTGINAIYKAAQDLETIMNYKFDKVSSYLGPTTVKLTQINGGSLHNVIPDQCSYVLDVRVNELYTLQEVVDELNAGTIAELKPRSLRWHSKGISADHPIFMVSNDLGIKTMGSPTLSDQVHCNFPTIKIGPGDSNRSHTADEYICKSEIIAGIKIYDQIVRSLIKYSNNL